MKLYMPYKGIFTGLIIVSTFLFLAFLISLISLIGKSTELSYYENHEAFDCIEEIRNISQKGRLINVVNCGTTKFEYYQSEYNKLKSEKDNWEVEANKAVEECQDKHDKSIKQMFEQCNTTITKINTQYTTLADQCKKVAEQGETCQSELSALTATKQATQTQPNNDLQSLMQLLSLLGGIG